VEAKAYLNGVEIEGQSTSKGRVIFTLSEQQILNQSTITLISGDLKPINRFQVQARKNAFNDVNIVVFNDNEEDTITPPIIPPAEPSPTPTTGGGGGGGGGAIFNQSNNPYLEALNQQFAQEAQAPQL
jgi:hypothetical protein